MTAALRARFSLRLAAAGAVSDGQLLAVLQEPLTLAGSPKTLEEALKGGALQIQRTPAAAGAKGGEVLSGTVSYAPSEYKQISRAKLALDGLLSGAFPPV